MLCFQYTFQRRENTLFRFQAFCTVIYLFAYFKHSCTCIVDLLIVQVVTSFRKRSLSPNVPFTAASAFHNIDDVFDVTRHLLVELLPQLTFLQMNAEATV